MGAARPKVDLAVVAERCQSLKLRHAAECLAELVEEASREDLSPVKFLERVLECEIERKDKRRIATSLRLSRLPVGRTLEGFDWTSQSTAESIEAREPWPRAPSYARPTTRSSWARPASQEPPRRGARREGHQERVQHHALSPR